MTVAITSAITNDCKKHNQNTIGYTTTTGQLLPFKRSPCLVRNLNCGTAVVLEVAVLDLLRIVIVVVDVVVIVTGVI